MESTKSFLNESLEFQSYFSLSSIASTSPPMISSRVTPFIACRSTSMRHLMCLDSNQSCRCNESSVVSQDGGLCCSHPPLPICLHLVSSFYNSIRLASSGLHDICEIGLSSTRIIPQLETRSKSLVCTTMEYVMGADSVCCVDTKGICNIVTYNKEYIFGLQTGPLPSFWHRDLKLLEFLM